MTLTWYKTNNAGAFDSKREKKKKHITWYKTHAGAFDSKREKEKSTKNECTPSGTDSG